MKVTNAVELEKALRAGETSIELTNSIGMPSSIHLQKGQKLVASGTMSSSVLSTVVALV